MLLAFLECLRPKQWTKNLLLFAGLIFAQQWSNPHLVLNAVLGFLVFCALSGVVYITNDILDVEKDRQHPKKRNRPIASGRIPVAAAATGGVLLLFGALGLTAALLPFNFLVAAVIYVSLITLYSFAFKHMVVLDILTLAMGFVVRAVAGIEVLMVEGGPKVPITSDFVLTTLFLALFLAICKRRNELVLLGDDAGAHRKVLADYSTEFLDVLVTVATAGVLFSYCMWTTQGQFAKGASGKAPEEIGAYALVFTIPFVLYGVFRYLWLVYKRDEGGAPEQLLLEDKPLLVTVLLWVATTVAILLILKGK